MFAASKTDGSSELPDPQFNYVTMLLHGDGTNGAQNNTFLDSSSNNFTITRNGNTTQGSFSPYGANWGNYFGGTSTASISDYLNVAGNSAFDPLASGSFTIEGWINPLQTQNFSRILCINSTFTTNSVGVNISTSGTYTGKLVFYSFNVANNMLVSDAIISLNTWTHFAICRSGSSFKMFINGTLQTATYTTASALFNNTSPFMTIGNGDVAVGGFSPFTGYISNLRIVTSALYSSTFTPSTTPLTAVSGTVLLTCQNNRFIDSSASPKTITIGAGTPSVQRFNPFGTSTAYSTSVIGGSGYFDGSGDSLQATAGAVPAIGTSNFIISGWWYLNELKDYQILFDFRNGSDSEAVPYIYVPVSGVADYYVNGASHNFSVALTAKQWYYILISRVSGTTKIFLNGTQVVSYSDSVTYVAGRLNLGFNNNSSTAFYYSGYISDFKVVIGSGTTSGTPTTTPATATSGTQALLSMTNGAIFDNAMMNNLETAGNAQISTSVVKYGTGSMAFDGTGDYLIGQVSPNLSFGTGNFTIEGWAYVTVTDATFQCMISIGPPVQIYAKSGTIKIYFNDTDNTSTYIVNGAEGPASSVSPNNWFHFAVVRNGTTFSAYVNGVAGTPTTGISDQVALSANPISLGIYGGTLTLPFTGYMDDIRITKGYARYTANFTPPIAAFPNIGPY